MRPAMERSLPINCTRNLQSISKIKFHALLLDMTEAAPTNRQDTCCLICNQQNLFPGS
jgi:hypothetical protein